MLVDGFVAGAARASLALLTAAETSAPTPRQPLPPQGCHGGSSCCPLSGGLLVGPLVPPAQHLRGRPHHSAGVLQSCATARLAPRGAVRVPLHVKRGRLPVTVLRPELRFIALRQLFGRAVRSGNHFSKSDVFRAQIFHSSPLGAGATATRTLPLGWCRVRPRSRLNGARPFAAATGGDAEREPQVRRDGTPKRASRPFAIAARPLSRASTPPRRPKTAWPRLSCRLETSALQATYEKWRAGQVEVSPRSRPATAPPPLPIAARLHLTVAPRQGTSPQEAPRVPCLLFYTGPYRSCMSTRSC